MTATNDPVEFFYEWAGYGYTPGKETPERGRRNGAVALADAERRAAELGWSFEWEIDPHIDSSDFSDDPEPWQLWCCCCRDEDGNVLSSLSGIDFGRDVEPWGQPYRRVVQAELALEALD